MLETKPELAPIFKDNKIKSEVKERLLKIAKDFYNELDLNLQIEDIVLVGSVAGFNYTLFSDIDLHILLDFSKAKDEQTTRKLADKSRYIWNRKHNIKIESFPVEVYIQDIKEINQSPGIYSLTNNDWIKKPTLNKGVNPSKDLIKKKSKDFIYLIKGLEYHSRKGKNVINGAKRLKQYIRDMRKAGLSSKAGIKSLENYIFKILRNTKYLNRLDDLINQQYDKSLSTEILRSQMPQGKSSDIQNILRNLDKQGTQYFNHIVPARLIKATQENFQPEKVNDFAKKMERGNWQGVPIFISRDMFCIDGHNRLRAYKKVYGNCSLNVIVIDKDKISALDAYRKATTKQNILKDKMIV